MAGNRFPLPKDIKVLLLSKHGANRKALESMLSFGSQNVVIISKNSIAKAVKELETDSYDIIIITSSILDENGIIDFIRQTNKLPIIIIDKYYNKILSEKVMDAGVRDYLDFSTLDSRLLIKSINFSLQQHQMAIRAKKTQRIMEMRNSFMANMSHEIRTPLNSIIGFSELLFEDETDAVKREKLNMIRQSGKHLLTLINSILDFSKLEAGKINIEDKEFSLDNLIQTLYYMMLVKSGTKNIDLNIKPIGKIPDIIIGDEFKLNQVLINLMNNAIKFTDEGSVTLEYGYINGKCIINVIDTGIGIPQDKINNIFNAFEQVNSPFSINQQGTGLGLAISKSLIELMNGKIEVTSIEGEGSQFSISVPLKLVAWETRSNEEKLINKHYKRKIAIAYIKEEHRNALEKWSSLKGYNTEWQNIGSFPIDDNFAEADLILLPQETFRGKHSEMTAALSIDHRTAFKPKVFFTLRNDRLFFLISKEMYKTQLIDLNSKFMEKNFNANEIVSIINQIFSAMENLGNKLINKWKKSFEQENPGLEEILKEAVVRFFSRQVELNQAYTLNDYKSIEEISHSLKGFTGQTCMYEVSNRANILLNEMRKQKEAPHPEVIKREITALNEIVWLLPRSEIGINTTSKPHSINIGLPKLRILVAEDNNINQVVIKDYLQFFGQDCTIVANGKEVLQKLAEYDFDLLLLDVQMPVMNGVETLRELRSNPLHKDLFVTIITAFLSEHEGLEFLNENANAFISKPFEKKEIKTILSQAVNHINTIGSDNE